MMHGKPTVVSYQTKDAKVYKESLKKIVETAVRESGFVPDSSVYRHYYVDCVYYFARIDQDSSNYDKCLLDAISETGLVWRDDNVALVRTQGVYYDKENPRIEIEIHPVEYIGVFENMESYDAFVRQCSVCKRGNRSCSVLRSAVEGRISGDIEHGVCRKFALKKQ